MRPRLAARSSGRYEWDWLQVTNCGAVETERGGGVGVDDPEVQFPFSGDGSRLLTVGVSDAR